MTYVDYIILGILVLFTIKGLFKGLVHQVMTLVGLIAGLLLAWQFYPVIAGIAMKIGINPLVSSVVAFIAIYIAVVVTARILAELLGKAIKFLLLGWLNKLAGGVFGLIEGLLFITIALVLISSTPLQPQIDKYRAKSPILNYMQEFAAPFSEKINERTKDLPKKIEKDV